MALWWVVAAIEGVVLLMVALTPWSFGSVEPRFEFYSYVGIAVLLALWGARTLLEGRFTWQRCPVALCLAAFFMYAVWQIMPLSPGTVASLSPSTNRVLTELVPEQSEALSGDAERPAVATPVGSTLSLYPGATRTELTRILAVFLLFAVVVNNLGTSASLQRLSIVAVANGAALALFGLVQFFTTEARNVLYWSVESDGTPFGPFVNRNHFAFYVNLCIGLGLGLLAYRGIRSPIGKELEAAGIWGSEYWRRRLHDVLSDPASLWVAAGLGLMMSSVPFCLSRGGVMALLGALGVCAVVYLTFSRGNWRTGSMVVSITMALGLLTWFGWDPVMDRLATIFSGEALAHSRAPIWSLCWPLIMDFPIWGTGFGTFQYVEPMYLHTPDMVGQLYAFAHNDYLEAVIEGGIVRLLLSLVTIGIVVGLGCMAFRNWLHKPDSGLVLGAMFAFTTTVIHSMGEFGLRIPAIVILVTVIAAQLSAMSRLRPSESRSRRRRSERIKVTKPPYEVRLAGFAPFAATLTALLLGWVLCAHSLRAARAEEWSVDSFNLGEAAGQNSLPDQLALLDAAVRADPENARVRFALAQTHFDLYERKSGQSEQPTELEALKKEHLLPALQHTLVARDLCPLMAVPHVRLAAHVREFDVVDSRQAYIQRAKRVAPSDPLLWYICGIQELTDGEFDHAWKSFERTLELSAEYLPLIINRSVDRLGPEEMLKHVLPDRAGVLLQAALQLYPGPDAVEDRRPFLERGLAVLEQDQNLSAEQYHVKGLIHRNLGDFRKSAAALLRAVMTKPEQMTWHYELAEVFYEQGRIQDARRELGIVLNSRRGDSRARALLEKLEEEKNF